ncbi:MAG: hypothetical protein DMG99_06680 [Acidobacteria bacterium]|nr:MAG: hypothetical protein DMG99_06680 [Acidobacteriota bacterium]
MGAARGRVSEEGKGLVLFRGKLIWLILALGTAPLKLQNYVGDLQMSSFRFDHRRVEELVSRTTNAVGKALERLRETEALLKKAGPLYPRGIPDNKKIRFGDTEHKMD